MISNGKNSLGKNTIVIGASIAGLLAARVLSDHFEQVTLLEKDIFPPPGENRKSVPQGKHVHVLLGYGRRIIEKLLPGITDELVNLDACKIDDVSKETLWYHTGFHKHGTSDNKVIGISRPTLEAAVRARVLALPNVHVMENCSVSGLTSKSDNNQITGVKFVSGKADNKENEMKADLVIDACGRGSHSPAWLKTMGYETPEEEQIKIGLGYSTCYYHRKPEHLSGYKGMLYLTTLERKWLGVLVPQSNGRWVATLGGFLGYDPPADYKEYLKFAKSLPSPDIYNVIKNEEPLNKPILYKFPASLRRHYEKLTRFPESYLVLGDALCSFNPIYGQGMTVAAMEAEALGECLSENNSNLAKRFFKIAAKLIDIPWNLSTSTDLMYPEVEGKRTPMIRFINWYINKLHIAAQNDAEVSVAFLNVTSMLAPPPSILHPRIIWRVIKGNLFKYRYLDTQQNEN